MAEATVQEPTKVCTRCGVEKPATLEFFRRQKAGKHGYRATCRECTKAQDAAYRVTPEAKRKRRDWFAANPGKRTEYNAKARETGRPQAYFRAYRAAHAEELRAAKAAYAKANPDKIRAWSAQARAANPEAQREYARRYAAKMRTMNPARAASARFTSLMNQSLRRAIGRGKSGSSWQQLVPYTVDDLMRHLERQFTKGMNWERFMAGEIHIDHIVPIKSFSFASEHDPEFRACWALTNLRPAWKGDNLSKGGKRLHLL